MTDYLTTPNLYIHNYKIYPLSIIKKGYNKKIDILFMQNK